MLIPGHVSILSLTYDLRLKMTPRHVSQTNTVHIRPTQTANSVCGVIKVFVCLTCANNDYLWKIGMQDAKLYLLNKCPFGNWSRKPNLFKRLMMFEENDAAALVPFNKRFFFEFTTGYRLFLWLCDSVIKSSTLLSKNREFRTVTSGVCHLCCRLYKSVTFKFTFAELYNENHLVKLLPR